MSSCRALTLACPRSRTNIAYTDQPHAAVMPSDTSVSIDAEPWRAFFSAARGNGHAAHPPTGAGSATSTHCPPGNRYAGNSHSRTETPPSGTKNANGTTNLAPQYG